jgi:hypothetical protein
VSHRCVGWASEPGGEGRAPSRLLAGSLLAARSPSTTSGRPTAPPEAVVATWPGMCSVNHLLLRAVMPELGPHAGGRAGADGPCPRPCERRSGVRAALRPVPAPRAVDPSRKGTSAAWRSVFRCREEAVARISTIAPGFRGVGDHRGMAHNFVVADRDQLLFMPPSVAEWLPDDHLAWFVLDVVAELDLAEFVAAYRPDGRGGAAYDPAMMVRCSCTRTALASGPVGASSAAALRTSRSECWQRTMRRITPRSLGSGLSTRTRWPASSRRCSCCVSVPG